MVPDEDNIPTRFFIFTTFTHSTFFSNMFHVNATCTYFKCKHMWSHGIRLINITMQLLLFASAQENINFSYITFITFHGAHCTVKADMRLSLKIYSCCKYIGQNARKVLYIAQLLRAKYFKPSATPAPLHRLVFLVADTQLYKRLCPSISTMVSRSIGP